MSRNKQIHMWSTDNKSTKVIQCRKNHLFNRWGYKNWTFICGKKMDSTELNVKAKTFKNLCGLGVRKDDFKWDTAQT